MPKKKPDMHPEARQLCQAKHLTTSHLPFGFFHWPEVTSGVSVRHSTCYPLTGSNTAPTHSSQHLLNSQSLGLEGKQCKTTCGGTTCL